MEKKEEIEERRKKEKIRQLRKGPDLEQFLEGRKRKFTTYAQGASLYSMNYYSFITLAIYCQRCIFGNSFETASSWYGICYVDRYGNSRNDITWNIPFQ